MGYLLLRVSNFGIAFSSVFSTITTTDQLRLVSSKPHLRLLKGFASLSVRVQYVAVVKSMWM